MSLGHIYFVEKLKMLHTQDGHLLGTGNNITLLFFCGTRILNLIAKQFLGVFQKETSIFDAEQLSKVSTKTE